MSKDFKIKALEEKTTPEGPFLYNQLSEFYFHVQLTPEFISAQTLQMKHYVSFQT
jgi:hypothetical protein